MSKIYQISVNNNFSFDIDKKTVQSLDAIVVSENQYHLLHHNTSYTSEIIKSDFNKKKYTIKVNDNEYSVCIADALDQLIKEMGFEVGAGKQVNDIKAPMPGLILEINVKVGDLVKENDSLLILEAMKMENNFLSPREGIIKSISVAQGDTVDKGQLLVEFE